MERLDVNYRKQLHPCRRWQTSKSTTEASAFASYQRVSDFSLAIMKGCDNIGDINLDMHPPPPPSDTRSAVAEPGAHFAAARPPVWFDGVCVFACVWDTARIQAFLSLAALLVEHGQFLNRHSARNTWMQRNLSLNQPPRAQCLAEFLRRGKHNKQRRAGCKRRFV